MHKIALLSNVNMNFVIRLLQKDFTVYETEGYGNELGVLMNPASSYYDFGAEYTFVIMDLMEVLEHQLEEQSALARINGWFATLEQCIRPEQIYYVSDGYLWGVELEAVWDAGLQSRLEVLWQNRLEQLCEKHQNVRILPYHKMIERMGADNAFSMKMWYMGKILLSNGAQQNLCELIREKVRVESRVPKKVLLLDLDDTLWGGLAGEHDHTPIVLSEDHSGLAYKNLQRVIARMQEQGVLLGIVSKNNEEDARNLLEQHPHMVLRPERFAVRKINWEPKYENILGIAKELNLGLDSFVFFDDNPVERQLVRDMLPEVTVPDFPVKPEDLAPAMAEIYKEYFATAVLTEEDKSKTRQYAENAERSSLQESAGSFEAYLEQLEIVIERVDPREHAERLVQLANKTNQFNLTTCRYTATQMQQILADESYRVYLYRVADRFGDNGIVAVMIVRLDGDMAVVEEWAMSCRVMGRNIEYALMDDVEDELREAGIVKVIGRYLETAKNKPVAELYDRLGYDRVAGGPGQGDKEYELCLERKPERAYSVKWQTAP